MHGPAATHPSNPMGPLQSAAAVAGEGSDTVQYQLQSVAFLTDENGVLLADVALSLATESDL